MTNEKEGWAAVSHFLGNLLLLIGMQNWLSTDNESERKRKEIIVFETQAQLAGHLYVIIQQMKFSGHDGEAAKIQQILDMVVEQDLANPDVRKAINAKELELSIYTQTFEAELAKLKAEHSK